MPLLVLVLCMINLTIKKILVFSSGPPNTTPDKENLPQLRNNVWTLPLPQEPTATHPPLLAPSDSPSTLPGSLPLTQPINLTLPFQILRSPPSQNSPLTPPLHNLHVLNSPSTHLPHNVHLPDSPNNIHPKSYLPPLNIVLILAAHRSLPLKICNSIPFSRGLPQFLRSPSMPCPLSLKFPSTL